MTPKQRAKMIDKARELQTGTYINKFAAPDFQRMIRAEAGAKPAGGAPAIVNGELTIVHRRIGQCACVTCGKVGPWKGSSLGGGAIETGHFVPSRRASIVFEESNAHPQCKHCNQHLGGNEGNYTLWMQAVYGQEEIDRLRRLKTTSVTFSRDELVDMRIEFKRRLKAAEKLIEENE